MPQHKTCVVPSCSSGGMGSSGTLSFHSFPANEQKKGSWLTRLGLNFNPSKHACICSKHFDPSSFHTSKDGRVMLNKDALPSLLLDNPHRSNDPVNDTETPKKKLKTSPSCRRKLFDVSCSPISFPMKNMTQVTPTTQRIHREHNYGSMSVHSQTSNQLRSYKIQLARAKIEIANLKKKLQRRDKKIKTVTEKASKKLIQSSLSLQKFPNILQELVKNQGAQNSSDQKKGMEYSEEVRKFAVTLHYYSPRAYMFLRQHLALPHPHSMLRWIDDTGCGTGINLRVIEQIASNRQIATYPSILTDVVITFDEMALHKRLVWDPKFHKFSGLVDLGTEHPVENPSEAGNAMVAMLVGISGGWKAPIGYIFTDKADGKIVKSFLDDALKALEINGFNVFSLICDGCTANVAAFKSYGIIENAVNPEGEDGPPRFEDIVTEFENPYNPAKKIAAMYDICHMLKLWRNMLKDCKDIYWSRGKVDFSFVELLNKLQYKEGILAANKLSNLHIDFERHKMKVKLAAQVLSRSVADALTFCRVDLKLPQFLNAKPTEDFLRLLDKFFDICNSRHPMQTCSKAPISKTNLAETVTFLQQFCDEVLKMTYMESRSVRGIPKLTKKYLARSMRKRAILGCVVSAKSIISIATCLLYRSEHPLKYLMTYRLSSDHIELFFNKVRGKFGRNNNPNAVEFRRFMVTNWHSSHLKSTQTGNCLNLIPEGEIPGGLLKLSTRPKQYSSNLEVEIPSIDLASLETGDIKSPFYKNCLAYISGNVVRSLCKTLKCPECIDALFNNNMDRIDENLEKLIQRKQYVQFSPEYNVKGGKGLFTPCKSVMSIVEKTDSLFRALVVSSFKPNSTPNLDLKIGIAVTQAFLGLNIFPHLQSHMFDFDPVQGQNHLTLLIKAISGQFLKIRLYDYGKRYQKSISTRHSLTKAVLFRHE